MAEYEKKVREILKAVFQMAFFMRFFNRRCIAKFERRI